MAGWRVSVCAAVLLGLAGCTVLRVDSDESAAGVRATGLVRGHAAWGISDEKRIANLRVLGGESRGAVAEIVVWKLFRLEVGLAGLSIGIGPLHFGLGALFYDPDAPRVRTPEAEDEEEELSVEAVIEVE